MDSFASQFQALIEFPIDFEGQKRAHRIVSLFVYVSAAVSVLAGLLTQNIVNTLFAFIGCIVVTFLLVAPPWSTFRQHPVKWLDVKYALH